MFAKLLRDTHYTGTWRHAESGQGQSFHKYDRLGS